jgi:hypothetical protein
MTNFPVSLDQFNNPTSSTKTNAPGFDHAEQHTNANDAIEALQSKIGIDQSLDEESIDFKIRRLLSRRLVNKTFGVGDGIATQFALNFAPIGDSLILVDGVERSASVAETTPGNFAVVFGAAPTGDLKIVAIEETL